MGCYTAVSLHCTKWLSFFLLFCSTFTSMALNWPSFSYEMSEEPGSSSSSWWGLGSNVTNNLTSSVGTFWNKAKETVSLLHRTNLFISMSCQIERKFCNFIGREIYCQSFKNVILDFLSVDFLTSYHFRVLMCTSLQQMILMKWKPRYSKIS